MANLSKRRMWRDAIDSSLDDIAAEHQLGGRDDVLKLMARALISQAMNGEQWALKEFGDRYEGKPAQVVELSEETQRTARLIING